MPGGGGSSSNAMAPATPQDTAGRVRGADELEGATLHQRPTQALRRAITLDFGDVNSNADVGLGTQGRYKGALPSGANVPKSYLYQDSKGNMGASIILITKALNAQQEDRLRRVYTTPEVLGMDVVVQLKTKHENEGSEGSFSKRLPGFVWIGYDPTGIRKGEKSIRKAAWICTHLSLHPARRRSWPTCSSSARTC